jgi:hypothetical protein
MKRREKRREEKRREGETPLETVIRLRARGDSRGGDCGELGPPHFWIFSLFRFFLSASSGLLSVFVAR